MSELNGGQSGRPVNVDEDYRVETASHVISKGAFVNDHDRQAYSQSATYTTAAGTDIFYFLKNLDDTLKCHVVGIRSYSTAADSFTVHRGTTGTPGGGAEITPVNLTSSTNTANVLSYGDADVTGLTEGSQVDKIFATAAGKSFYHEFPLEIILLQNDGMSLKATTAELWDFTVYFYMKE